MNMLASQMIGKVGFPRRTHALERGGGVHGRGNGEKTGRGPTDRE
jgi:hypothetical protein